MRAWSLTALRLVMGFGFMAQSIPLILSMIGAMLTVQLRYGLSSINTIGLTPDGPVFGPPGYAGLLALALGGPDALSVDRWRAQRHGRSAVRG
jgi:putative oxidoreductase